MSIIAADVTGCCLCIGRLAVRTMVCSGRFNDAVTTAMALLLHPRHVLCCICRVLVHTWKLHAVEAAASWGVEYI
jgi:hypothetical protein